MGLLDQIRRRDDQLNRILQTKLFYESKACLDEASKEPNGKPQAMWGDGVMTPAKKMLFLNDVMCAVKML